MDVRQHDVRGLRVSDSELQRHHGRRSRYDDLLLTDNDNEHHDHDDNYDDEHHDAAAVLLHLPHGRSNRDGSVCVVFTRHVLHAHEQLPVGRLVRGWYDGQHGRGRRRVVRLHRRQRFVFRGGRVQCGVCLLRDNDDHHHDDDHGAAGRRVPVVRWVFVPVLQCQPGRRMEPDAGIVGDVFGVLRCERHGTDMRTLHASVIHV